MFRCCALSLLSVGLIYGQAVLRSPNGNLEITLNTAADHRLVYSVSYKGKSLLEESNLQLTLQGARPLGSDVRITGATPSQADETYTLVTGKASRVRNHYNALSITTEENSGRKRELTIEARAYDDAIAFRYVVPQQPRLHDYRLVSAESATKEWNC